MNVFVVGLTVLDRALVPAVLLPGSETGIPPDAGPRGEETGLAMN
jgi:hypothetical protein